MKRRKESPPVETRRIKFAAACRMLSVSRPTLQGMLGSFTVQQDVEGGDRYLLVDEIEFFLNRAGAAGERIEALNEFRRDKGRTQ